jgi:hypothetical protein
MTDENLTSSIAAIDQAGVDSKPGDRERLLELVRMSLTRPDALTAASLGRFAGALVLDKNDHERCELALASIAALLYSRPDLVGASIVDQLASLLSTSSLPESIGQSVVKLFAFLAASPHAPYAWEQVSLILGDDRLDARTRDRMLPLVSEFLRWSEDIVGVDAVITLAQSPALANHRTWLFDEAIERLVYRAPEAFTPERLALIANLFADAPRYPHVLYSLAQRQSLAEDTRGRLTRELAGRFPFQDVAAAILKNGQISLLVVLNVGMGQGDDMVRLAPMLQGMLDANPALSVTLITWRPYLYDNDQVTTVQITDDAAVREALTGSFDGVIEFFQPEWSGFTFKIEVHVGIEKYVAEHNPALVIKGDLGRAYEHHAGGRLPFLYQTVKIGDIEIAQSRGLDQCTVKNVYEPTMRLLAELGLPQRAAEEIALAPSVLTGIPSADAGRIWAELIATAPDAGKRPVALLNPFGGSGITKGFHEQDALVAAEIAALVEEGFLVVVLPNGQSWGRRAAIGAILSRLDAGVRANVRVAPDPAETDEGAQVALFERAKLAYRDQVMRMFKYFAAYADLSVTTEGWLAHMAYILGRPLRLFLAAGSFAHDYHPRFRGPHQTQVPALSSSAAPEHSRTALLRDGDPPPLPHQPRKPLLELALAGLGRFGDARDATAARLASKSPDAYVRTWAFAALGRIAPHEAKVELIAALQDRWPGVMREASQALLRAEIDCSRELGAHYPELLQGYIDIDKQNWDAVAALGPKVIPALSQAANSDLHDVKDGAKKLLARILTPFVPTRGTRHIPTASSS